MQIRQIPVEEVPLITPLRTYAFEATPVPDAREADLGRFMSYRRGNTTLIAEEDGEVLASVSGIPMRQNVRGVVHPMLGVAGVVSHPLARRRGHVRTLMHDLLRRFQEEGYPVSALYPFRPSFYGRIGYLGLPAAKTVTLRPADLSALLEQDLPGEVRLRRIADAWDDFTGFLDRQLIRRHGLAEFPGYRLQEWRDTNDRWLLTAHLDGEVAAMVSYRITDYAGDLTVESLLHTGPLSRALLLRFLAGHVDQVDRIVARVAPDERPELWTTDFTGTIASTIKIPDGAPPMVRVLNVAALAGLPAGEARAELEILDDPLIGGRYLLDGAGGALSVKPGAGSGEAKLSAAALAGLVYGVLDPEDVVARGLGTIPAESRQALRTMFPPAAPYVHLSF